VGLSDGELEGSKLGDSEGTPFGEALGDTDGCADGLSDNKYVGEFEMIGGSHVGVRQMKSPFEAGLPVEVVSPSLLKWTST
jgi:hypothetical protein